MFNLAGASSPRIWEGGRTLWSTSWSWVFTTFLTLHKNKMQPFNLRGFWLHTFLDHYIYEATLYEIVEGRWSPRSLCLCELYRETGASIPDSDWTANMTNSGSEPTTKRQRFQFGIDELKMLIIREKWQWAQLFVSAIFRIKRATAECWYLRRTC